MTDHHDVALVTVFATGEAALIAVAKSLLEAEGIDYVVRGEGLSNLFGHGLITTYNFVVGGPPEFMVREEDAERAREMLKDLATGE